MVRKIPQKLFLSEFPTISWQRTISCWGIMFILDERVLSVKNMLLRLHPRLTRNQKAMMEWKQNKTFLHQQVIPFIIKSYEEYIQCYCSLENKVLFYYTRKRKKKISKRNGIAHYNNTLIYYTCLFANFWKLQLPVCADVIVFVSRNYYGMRL